MGQVRTPQDKTPPNPLPRILPLDIVLEDSNQLLKVIKLSYVRYHIFTWFCLVVQTDP